MTTVPASRVSFAEATFITVIHARIIVRIYSGPFNDHTFIIILLPL